MRLKRIELYEDFRSLKSGFILDFINNYNSYDINNAIDPFCIVGRNGSGKSNILELLSAIFYQVEVSCLDFLPKETITKFNEDDEEYEEEVVLSIFQSFETIPNAYKLEYYITLDEKETLVTIEKEANQYRKIYLDNNPDILVDKKELQNIERPILPEHIIGYSSGQNEILSLPFYKMRLIQYEEYLDYLKYSENFINHESRMLYLDDDFSQAIFITNFIYTDETVNKVFTETIGIESVESFRIVINQNVNIKIEGEEKKIIHEVKKKIDLLKSCATMSYSEDGEISQLILDFYLDDTVKKAFKLKFGSGLKGRLNLFQTLQTLINLNYYHIDEKTKHKLYRSKSLFAKGYLPQPPWNRRFFTFKNFMLKKTRNKETIHSRSLSDGEYQFLHSIGIALIYRGTQSLFLLDEPETHFNPSWRAEYMNMLKKCFENTKIKAEFLITSHSPFIVSDTKKDNVILLENTQRKQINFNTFGASIDSINLHIFKKEESISNIVSTELIKLQNQIINNKIDKQTALKQLREFGDSFEKMLVIHELRVREVN